MRRLAIVLGLAAALAGALAGLLAADPAVPVLDPAPRLWRPTLRAGEWFYYWSRARNVGGSASLVNAAGVVTPLPTVVAPGWFRPYWRGDTDCGWKIPEGTPPGRYTLTIGRAAAGTLTVTAPATPAPWNLLNPSPPLLVADDGVRIAAALAVGDVQLNPGEYRVRRPFAVPADRTLRGRGAHLIGLVPDGASNAGCFVQPGDRSRFEGLTFESGTGSRIFGDPSVTAANVTVTGCTFRRTAFGAWTGSAGLLIENCVFDRASLDTLGGMHVGNQILGQCPVGHSFYCQTLTSPLAVIDLTMDGTDRGLNMRPSGSDLDNCLLACLDFRHIRQTQNGDELLNTETGDPARSFSNNLLLQWRSSNTDGSVQFIPVCRNNLMQSCALDATLYLWGPATGNEFTDVQLSGNVQVQILPRATGNTFTRLILNYGRPDFLNQHGGGARRPAALVEGQGPDAATNVLRDAAISGARSGIPATTGVTVQR